MVCSILPVSYGAVWDENCVDNNKYVPTTIGAGGTGIGHGILNTDLIVRTIGTGNSAAAICVKYRGGDYSDWYLPSRDEAYEIYNAELTRCCEIWTSTETVNQNGVSHGVTIKGCYGVSWWNYTKYYEAAVHAVRNF